VGKGNTRLQGGKDLEDCEERHQMAETIKIFMSDHLAQRPNNRMGKNMACLPGPIW
jgi:hypothetical protein